ncbi:DEAD/DEAH box helicase [[Muricauda] lutisoli]|uniref:DEAD/DEAH box helicase family protein n=1 Tax=[Muricauda] lutisoli TaxID=2816035 RepID=A0ABS3EW53_9FLAO|nr:DEAD/DEAH box helicase family protein [[Muricauda] lutisoli]MBO0330400.1 DEAD/DEAH box helicase family protein [[Muricauda] lutisoli]
MEIKLPNIEKLIYENGDNHIKQYYEDSPTLDFEFVQSTPFIISSNGESYFITNKTDDEIPQDCNYALLATRKPSKKYFLANSLKLYRWIKHPSFEDLTPQDVLTSWKGKFKFIKEDLENDIKGLRPPQLGALYSILAHTQSPEDKGVVVMPTGTGKTETMLSTLVANECEKLLVAVPSDSLRTQLSNKFSKLGLLREFGMVDDTCHNPIVGVIQSKFESKESLLEFITKTNVVVTTMSILGGGDYQHQMAFSDSFSHLFVDEAHHSAASTWKKFINRFDKEKVFLFTATPFRNDGKNLDGKFIFNFSLKEAQRQGYYKQINYLPIREYDKDEADKKIADRAVEQLREDLANGYPHIIMARCVSKSRAKDVFKHYKEHEDLNPVIVYTGVPGLKDKVKAIKAKQHGIIVCVNMLGEGFDLPELKIAAIHDERQSLPITLQFVGRFTRTSFADLGNASFVTNIAYPPIQQELNHLYAKNADWNLLLPNISEGATDKEINFQEFLDGFNDLENSKIPFQNINPAMSSVVFRNNGDVWNPKNWKEGINNIGTYEHQFSRINNEKGTLVIILGKVDKVEWGDFDVVQNMDWNMIVVHWDTRPNKNLVFIHTSLKNLSYTKLVKSIFGDEVSQIKGMDVFKIFHEVKRLTLYNVGARKGTGRDISFQSFFGKGVQDGIKLLEQGTFIKNNFFGVGYKDGEKVSLGCSVKGKVWSYLRGNLDELIKWCKDVGDVLINPNINPNTVLENTLIPKTITVKPEVTPIAVEWHHEMFQHAENRYRISINGSTYDLSNSELNIVESPNHAPLRFCFKCEDYCIEYDLVLGAKIVDGKEVAFHKVTKKSIENPIIEHGSKRENLGSFLQEFTPIFWFADGSQLFQNSYVVPKPWVDGISLDNIIPMNWEGVSIGKEAQGIVPYETDSIQYHFINQIRADYEIIYDDDGSGEIADVIGINDGDNKIDIHLFHLKYAKNGHTGNDIGNFYEVCGQAQKSLNWKYRNGKDFFDHLLRRVTKKKNGATCSRIIKGSEDDLERLLNAAKWTKEMKFHICIVQPSLVKGEGSNNIMLLLGNTHHYLHTVGNVELKVYSS